MSSLNVTLMPDRATRLQVADPIRAHLAVARISGAELARRIGMDQASISRRLNGQLSFTADDLVAIANELGVTLIDLLQMPKNRPIGGGTSFVGAHPLHRGIMRLVGPEGLEPPASSVKARELAVVLPFVRRAV